jgi:pyrroloquinoline-quinone synthase
VTRDEFKEALLALMERKQHWAWPAFGDGRVKKELFHVHLEQEYAVYVRDFPVLVGRAYVQCPLPAVRRELAENLYEEETGALHAGRPHPELFLDYPKGLGFDLSRFENVELLPGAQRYRSWLDEVTQHKGWAPAAAVVTLFIEGTQYERNVFDPAAPAKPEPPLAEHPLVKLYGMPVEALALTKAHRGVEGDHRKASWRVMLDHVPESQRRPVIEAMEESLVRWLGYRDDVAAACGVSRES